MRVSVLGCGYLGEQRLDAPSRAVPPSYEPGFEHLLTRAQATGGLRS